MGLAPTGKRRLVTAHANCRPSAEVKTTKNSSRRSLRRVCYFTVGKNRVIAGGWGISKAKISVLVLLSQKVASDGIENQSRAVSPRSANQT